MFCYLYWTQTHSSMPKWADAHTGVFISGWTLTEMLAGSVLLPGKCSNTGRRNLKEEWKGICRVHCTQNHAGAQHWWTGAWQGPRRWHSDGPRCPGAAARWSAASGWGWPLGQIPRCHTGQKESRHYSKISESSHSEMFKNKPHF